MRPLKLVFLILAANLSSGALAAQRSTGYERHAQVAQTRTGIADGRRVFAHPSDRRHAPRRVWVPGHYRTVPEQVWVAARFESVWVEPRYELRHTACGDVVRVLVQPGHWKRVYRPAHFETCDRRIWVPGCYVLR